MIAKAAGAAELTLEIALTSPGQARRWAADVLEEWSLAGLRDDVQAVVSELVSNAVLHARTPVTVRPTVRDAQLRVAV